MNRQSFFTFQALVFGLVAAAFTTVYITQPVPPILQQEFGGKAPGKVESRRLMSDNARDGLAGNCRPPSNPGNFIKMINLCLTFRARWGLYQ